MALLKLGFTHIIYRHKIGETERLLLDSYINGDENLTQNQEIESLSSLEKQLVKNQMIVETRGKRGNKVEIFPQNLKEATDLLVQYRKNASVDPKNEYLFARANFGSLSYIRGCDVIRNFAKACGAKQPKMLTSSKLRIHLGTMTQFLNLNDGELDNLASFMGHSIAVHNEFYKWPKNTLYLVKASKLLIALERGKLSEYRGKSLDEIDFEFSDDEECERNESDTFDNFSDEEENQIPSVVNKNITSHQHSFTSRKISENVESSSDEDADGTQHQFRKIKKKTVSWLVGVFWHKFQIGHTAPGKVKRKLLWKEKTKKQKIWIPIQV